MRKTLFTAAALLLAMCAATAQPRSGGDPQLGGGGFEAPMNDLEEVYRNDNVVWRRLNDNTLVGSGHVMASETLYLLEGRKRALLIDTGTYIPDLDKIVARLTDKPYDVILTHVHPDHAGGVGPFAEVWINPADTVGIPTMMADYAGKVRFLANGQKFNLGGRVIEAYFTPGHTPGSTTFLEAKAGTGYSGDSFGNGNLLLTTDCETMLATCLATEAMMEERGITHFYNGHYFGQIVETQKRVHDVGEICRDILDGKVSPQILPQSMLGLDHIVTREGVRVNYGKAQVNTFDKLSEEAMEETCKFLQDCGTYYLATVEGDQPRVRPFGTAEIIDGHLCIQTGHVKNVARQIAANPKVEICAFDGKRWLRVSATLVEDTRVSTKKAMLDANPSLRGMYDENDENTAVFYLTEAQARFCSFTEPERVVEF